MDRIVILGAGEAGCAAAVALREGGFAGAITLVGREELTPYERPPLSKDVLITDPLPSPKMIAGATRFDELDVVFLAATEAVAIDRPGHRVQLSSGREVLYDRLLLTLGAEPRQLPWSSARLLTLRTYQDALRLRETLRSGCHVAVIGGGFIGLESAAAAAARGCQVTVIEAAPRILARAVPADIAAIVAERHRSAGVVLRLNCIIADIAETTDSIDIALAGGTRLSADIAVVGIGAAPTIQLAVEAGLRVDNGIRVNDRLATSDPDIFAAGDCASVPHPLYGGRAVRLEAWRNALDQGGFAARAMLGSAQSFDAVPWFWSDQYDLNLQIAGLIDPTDTITIRDLGDGVRLQFHLDPGGRLTAACAVGRTDKIGREVRLAEMLIARRAHPGSADLANPEVRLKQLLAQAS